MTLRMISPGQNLVQFQQTNTVGAAESLEVKLECGVGDEARCTATQNATQTVIVEDLQAMLILYTQWPGLATVENDRPSH